MTLLSFFSQLLWCIHLLAQSPSVLYLFVFVAFFSDSFVQMGRWVSGMERERETDRQTEKQTDRQTEKQTDRQTERESLPMFHNDGHWFRSGRISIIPVVSVPMSPFIFHIVIIIMTSSTVAPAVTVVIGGNSMVGAIHDRIVSLSLTVGFQGLIYFYRFQSGSKVCLFVFLFCFYFYTF